MWRLIAVFSFLALTGCNKEKCSIPSVSVDQTQLAIDGDLIDQYLTDKGITAQTHATGIRYEIIEPGQYNEIDDCTEVFVSYKGYLLDDTVFDQTPSGSWADFTLSQVITGWRIGLPLVKEKGKINLYIPSGYAYGPEGREGSIPANAPLIFEIEVLGVINQLK